ncbi:hypothetical protein HMPREF3198_00722 [Winkia neuii]|nr:hypothetical protein HMPREF3198_00722 [Winkia neuii]
MPRPTFLAGATSRYQDRTVESLYLRDLTNRPHDNADVDT